MPNQEDIINDHLGMARWAASRWAGDLDPDEAYAICLLRMCEVVHKYDPERGKFSSFITPYLYGALLDERRKLHGRKGRSRLWNISSLDAIREYDERFDIVDQHVQEPYLDTGLYQAMQHLEAREHIVLKLRYFDNQSFNAIGETLGVSESRACQIHIKALKKLRRYYLAHGAA